MTVIERGVGVGIVFLAIDHDTRFALYPYHIVFSGLF